MIPDAPPPITSSRDPVKYTDLSPGTSRRQFIGSQLLTAEGLSLWSGEVGRG